MRQRFYLLFIFVAAFSCYTERNYEYVFSVIMTIDKMLVTELLAQQT